jgi:hypothetical protein
MGAFQSIDRLSQFSHWHRIMAGRLSQNLMQASCANYFEGILMEAHYY